MLFRSPHSLPPPPTHTHIHSSPPPLAHHCWALHQLGHLGEQVRTACIRDTAANLGGGEERVQGLGSRVYGSRVQVRTACIRNTAANLGGGKESRV